MHFLHHVVALSTAIEAGQFPFFCFADKNISMQPVSLPAYFLPLSNFLIIASGAIVSFFTLRALFIFNCAGFNVPVFNVALAGYK